MEPERLLTIPEMAKLMGINQGTINDLVRTGLIPVLKFGRVRKARVSAFNAFLQHAEGKDIYELARGGETDEEINSKAG